MTKALFIIALTATFAVLGSSAVDWCGLKTCKHPDQHIICKYGFLRINRNQCSGLKSSSLTPSEITEILNAHNEYRRFVASGAERRGKPGPQPAATNLGPLRWDPELARIAQSWADQCNFDHDDCRDVERFQVGQNIGHVEHSHSYNAKWSDVVKDWYNEVQVFDRNLVKSYPRFSNEIIGHYTQLVWAKTKLLGCGGVRYREDGWYRTYLVCNYGPGGNWEDHEIYKTR